MFASLREDGRLPVKICGVRSQENAQAVVDAGADALGVNFFSGSKRFVPFEEAAGWLGKVDGTAERVAVFVNAPTPEIRRAAESGLFHAVQMHGSETPDMCAEVRTFGLPVIRALSVCSAEEIEALRQWPVDALLLDARVPGAFGGTGQTCDWGLAALAVRALAPMPVFLSGGLTPGNVGDAIAAVRPAGVDVAGGVESPDGFKDPDKVRAFLTAAARAGRT